MIEPGDVFNAQVVLLPVACDGRMGAGVNLRARQRYPLWYSRYQADCAAGQIKLGHARVYHVALNRWLIVLPVRQSASSPIDDAVIEAVLATVPPALAETAQAKMFIDVRSLCVADVGQDRIERAIHRACGPHALAWLQLPDPPPAPLNGCSVSNRKVMAGDLNQWREHVLQTRRAQETATRRAA